MGCPFFKWEEYIEHVESLKEGMGFSQHLMPQEQASASNAEQVVESKEQEAAVGMKKELILYNFAFMTKVQFLLDFEL